jgi:primosomal protein DnaI
MSSWVRDDILGVILQYRMQEQLPTFFSSNFNMLQLENEHLRVTQRGEDEPLKAKRIMERVRFLAKEINMIGKNRRLYD